MNGWPILTRPDYNKLRTSYTRSSTLIGRETVVIHGRPYKVFTYLENRDHCRASIGAKGIYIRLVRYMSKDEQKSEYLKLKEWAVTHLQQRTKPADAQAVEEGRKVLTIWGKEFEIRTRYVSSDKSKATINDDHIELRISSGMSEAAEQRHTSSLIGRLLAAAYLPAVRARLEALNVQHFKRPVSRVSLTNNLSNWGSCSVDGHIKISVRLLLAPEHCIDYVIIHELAHLVEHNHSRRFWALVEKVMPDYKQAEKWLDTHGHLCHF